MNFINPKIDFAFKKIFGDERHRISGGQPQREGYWRKRNRTMLTQTKIKKIIAEAYPYLSEEYGVKKIGLFGSYAQGQPTETSDIDLVVELEQPLGFRFIELTEELERLLGKKVEALTPAGIRGIRQAEIAAAIEASVVYV